MQPPASDRPACTRPLAQAATEQDTRSSGVIRGYQESSGVITRPLAQTATSRTYGQDSSGFIRIHQVQHRWAPQESSWVITHLRTQRQRRWPSHLAAKVCNSPLDPRVEYDAQVTELVLLLSRHLAHLMRDGIREAIRGNHGGTHGGHQSSRGPPPLQACPARSRDLRVRTRPCRASRRPCP